MRKALICLALAPALMAGMCGSREPPVVRVPVPVSCLDRAQFPAEVPPVGPLPRDARQASDILAATVIELRSNDRVWRALAIGCLIDETPEG